METAEYKWVDAMQGCKSLPGDGFAGVATTKVGLPRTHEFQQWEPELPLTQRSSKGRAMSAVMVLRHEVMVQIRPLRL